MQTSSSSLQSDWLWRWCEDDDDDDDGDGDDDDDDDKKMMMMILVDKFCDDIYHDDHDHMGNDWKYDENVGYKFWWKWCEWV